MITTKAREYLEQFIGQEIIRTAPIYFKSISIPQLDYCRDCIDYYYDPETHLREEWGYTEEPIKLLGFSQDNRIICKYTDNSHFPSRDEKILRIEYTDCNWILYTDAFNPKNNQLNKWKGKKIKRIRPAGNSMDFMCNSPTSKPPILISASKYHVILMLEDPGLEGTTIILDARYANPKDWTLA